MNALRSKIVTSILSEILGIIQMIWFLPNGMSCSDLNRGIVDAVIFYIPIQIVIVLIISSAFKNKIGIILNLFFLISY